MFNGFKLASKSVRTPILLVGGIISLLVCSCCLVLAWAGQFGQQAAQSQPTIEITFVSQDPTKIAATFQPISPTSPPTPTPTEPPPTAAFTDSLDPTRVQRNEDAAYVDRLMKILSAYQSALSDLSQLLQQLQTTPSLLVAERWKFAVAANLAAILLAGEEVRKLTPPESLAEVHLELVAASRHYDFAAERIAYMIDNLDLQTSEEIRKSLEAGARHMNRARELITSR